MKDESLLKNKKIGIILHRFQILEEKNFEGGLLDERKRGVK